MSKLFHAVLTPFSIPMRGNPYPTEDWCRDTLERVRHLFVPGMNHQTSPPDAWIFAVGPTTPADVRDELESFGITLVEWCDGLSHTFLPFMPNEVKITTRTDCDDRLSPDACERIQRWGASSPDEGIFNFSRGYSVSEHGHAETYWPGAAFFSRKANGVVFGLGTHQDIHLRYPNTVLDDTAPGWARMCHSSNHSGPDEASIDAHRVPGNVELPDWAKWPEGVSL